MRSTRVRKQQIPMTSVYPITIPDDYTYIRTDFKYNFLSNIAYIILSLLLGIVFFKIISPQKIYGRKNLKPLKKKGFISVANHCHFLDTVLTGSALRPRRPWFASVQRNFEATYLIRKMLRVLRGFPIPDGAFGLSKLIKPVVDAVNEEKIIHLYPEEELWHLHQGIDYFQKGAFILAHHANCPVVPIVHLFQPRTFFGRKISKNILNIKSVIGEPIYPRVPKVEGESVNLESVQEMSDNAQKWMRIQVEEYHQNSKKKN